MRVHFVKTEICVAGGFVSWAHFFWSGRWVQFDPKPPTLSRSHPVKQDFDREYAIQFASVEHDKHANHLKEWK